MDSPRGRILLMRIGHEEGEDDLARDGHPLRPLPGLHGLRDRLPVGRAVRQADRAHAAAAGALGGAVARASAPYRRAIFALFTHPGRLRALVAGLERWRRSSPPLAPTARLKALLALAPAGLRRRGASGGCRRSSGPKAPVRRGTVAFMQGCIQRVFFGDVNAATVRVLVRRGLGGPRPRQPRCCGALQMHAGVEDEALGLARQTIAAYEGFDVVVANVAGCGSRDEGLRPPAVRRPRVGRAGGRRSRPRSATCTSCWPSTSRRPSATRIAAARRLPRRLPPRPRPAGPHAAARAAARHPRPGAARAGRVGAVLRLGRHLQPAPARGGGQARRAQGGEPDAPPAPRRSPPPTRAARCRSGATSISPSTTR